MRRFSCLLLFICLLSACQSAPPAPETQAVSALLALAPQGGWLAALNPDSESVTLLTTEPLGVVAEIPLGAAPRSLAFDPAGTGLWVSLAGNGTIVRVSTQAPFTRTIIPLPNPFAQPTGIVSNGGQVFVSLQATGEVAVIDAGTLTVTRYVPVAALPTGLALQGRALYVTHLHTGMLTRLDTTTQRVVWAEPTAPEASGAQFVALGPGRVYVPEQRTNAGNLALTYDTTVDPVVSVVGASDGKLVETLALAQLGEPVSLPTAAVVSADGRRLYVVNAGSEDVAVLDLQTQTLVAQVQVGASPRGVAVDEERLYVNNTLAGTLSVFALRDGVPTTQALTVTLTTLPLTPTMLLGKQLFNSARGALAADDWLACASCHWEGGADGRTWLGFPDGPRNTPSLLGVGGTGPWHWSGDLDELQDVEFTVRRIQGGSGLLAADPHPTLGEPNTGRSAALDALALYVASLAVPLSPYNGPDGFLTAAGLRGQALFHDYGCAACHVPPNYMDGQQHVSSIGTLALERNAQGLAMDTPTLLGAWATAPYFHDGSAATLRAVLLSSGAHTLGYALDEAELADLAVFVQSLPTRSPALKVRLPPK